MRRSKLRRTFFVDYREDRRNDVVSVAEDSLITLQSVLLAANP